MIMNERHTMDNGVPDCPECGGKGMCDEHKREYLKWVYETARDEYYASLTEQITKLETEIKNRKEPK